MMHRASNRPIANVPLGQVGPRMGTHRIDREDALGGLKEPYPLVVDDYEPSPMGRQIIDAGQRYTQRHA